MLPQQPESTSEHEATQPTSSAQSETTKRAKAVRRDEMKQKYTALVTFLKQQGLKFKVGLVGKSSVEYFRVKQLRALLAAKQAVISSNAEVNSLMKGLQWREILHFYERFPDQRKLKWPKQLQKSDKKCIQEGKFAAFKFPTYIPTQNYLAYVVVAVILGWLLFPLWPEWLKYALLVTLQIILGFILLVLAINIVLYVFGALLGADMVLFPRLNQQCALKDSFSPIFAFKRWEQNVYGTVARLAAFLLISYTSYVLYNEPHVFWSNWSATKSIVMQVHEWGEAAISKQQNFSQKALLDANSKSEQTQHDDYAL